MVDNGFSVFYNFCEKTNGVPTNALVCEVN